MKFHRLKELRRLPHPGRGFTQGLLLSGDTVWESTGLYGQSALRRYRLGAKEWEACALLPGELFALTPLEVILVRCEGERVGGLNDLEWYGGRIWANILARPYLVGIDPGTGEVTDIVDAHLGGEHHFSDPQAVLNGIAATGRTEEFLLTGKGWRFLHHVRLADARQRRQPARLLVPADLPACPAGAL